MFDIETGTGRICLLLFHGGKGKSLQNDTEFIGWMINYLLAIYISGDHNSCPSETLSGAQKVAP